MLLYIANISDYKTPAIPVMTKIVEVSDMINNVCRDLLDFNNGIIQQNRIKQQGCKLRVIIIQQAKS